MLCGRRLKPFAAFRLTLRLQPRQNNAATVVHLLTVVARLRLLPGKQQTDGDDHPRPDAVLGSGRIDQQPRRVVAVESVTWVSHRLQRTLSRARNANGPSARDAVAESGIVHRLAVVASAEAKAKAKVAIVAAVVACLPPTVRIVVVDVVIHGATTLAVMPTESDGVMGPVAAVGAAVARTVEAGEVEAAHVVGIDEAAVVQSVGTVRGALHVDTAPFVVATAVAVDHQTVVTQARTSL